MFGDLLYDAVLGGIAVSSSFSGGQLIGELATRRQIRGSKGESCKSLELLESAKRVQATKKLIGLSFL